jgi:hypothetical protein
MPLSSERRELRELRELDALLRDWLRSASCCGSTSSDDDEDACIPSSRELLLPRPRSLLRSLLRLVLRPPLLLLRPWLLLPSMPSP